MQLTRAADYAVRAMVHLAGLPPSSRASIAELAKAAEVSEAFLTKVLQRLTSAKLVISFRGAAGGFGLSAPPSDISLLDIVEAIEGPIQLNACTGCEFAPSVGCPRQSWCAAHTIWLEAQQQLRQFLASASIERLAQQAAQNLAAAERAS